MNLKTQSLDMFDEDILVLAETGDFKMLDDENIRRNLQLLLEFREGIRIQKTGYQGLIPITPDAQVWYEKVRGEFEMMRRLINIDARSLEEVPLSDKRNPIHEIIELR